MYCTVLFQKRVGIRFKITLEDAIASPAALFCGTGGVAATDENDGVGGGRIVQHWMDVLGQHPTHETRFFYTLLFAGNKNSSFRQRLLFRDCSKIAARAVPVFRLSRKNRLVVL